MKLTIEAVDLQSLKFQIYDICKSFGLLDSPYSESGPAPTDPDKASVEPTPLPKTARAPRAKKVSHEASVSSGEEQSSDSSLPITPAEKVVQPSLKDAVFASLKKVSSLKGMVVAKQVLTQFHCARISELKEDQFPEFIKACEQAAA